MLPRSCKLPWPDSRCRLHECTGSPDLTSLTGPYTCCLSLALALHAGALQVYCAAGLFDRARELAAGGPALQRYVDEQYTSHLVASRNADELASRGDAGSAIDLYCQQGEWTKVYELAGRQGGNAVGIYAARQAMVKVGLLRCCGAAVGSYGACAPALDRQVAVR
jgi:hypothetical protein